MPVAIGWQTYADYVALINAHPARIHPEEKYQDRFSLSMVEGWIMVYRKDALAA